MRYAEIIIKITVACLVIYLLYYAYRYYNPLSTVETSKTLVDKQILMDEDYHLTIKRSEIFDPNINMSLTWRMKIFNIPSNFLWKSSYRLEKLIFQNGNCFDVRYVPADNKLILRFNMINNNLENITKDLVIEDLPLQHWISIGLVVESRYVNLYLNGELKYSYKLPTVPVLPESNFEIGLHNNNFLGKVSNVVYHNKTLTMTEMKSSL